MSTKQITMIVSALILIGALGWLGYLVRVEANDQAGPGGHEMEADDEEHTKLMAQPKEASNGQARLVITLDPQTGAEVGDAVRVGARVTDTSGRPITNVAYTVSYWHIEDEKVVFGTKAMAPDGSLSWEFAPFDGVPYEVQVTAASTAQSSVAFGSLQAKPVLFVEALAPPLRVKILNTFYLVAVVGLGVATGLWAVMRRAARGSRAMAPGRAAAVPA
jgi:hypothetical protein